MLYSLDRNGNTLINGDTQYFHDWISLFSIIIPFNRSSTHMVKPWRTCDVQQDTNICHQRMDGTAPKNPPKRIAKTCLWSCPLLVDTNHLKGGPTLLRFENMWLQYNSSSRILKCGGQPVLPQHGLLKDSITLQFIKSQLKKLQQRLLRLYPTAERQAPYKNCLPRQKGIIIRNDNKGS